MGPGHRAVAAVSAAGALVLTSAPVGVSAGALVVVSAVVTSAGALSPDVDQTRAWRRVTGGRGVFAHRRVTHWPIWPVALWFLASALVGVESALALGACVGWGSHVVADWLFGGRWSPVSADGWVARRLTGPLRDVAYVVVPLAVLSEWT
jgi:membrane-bound metal-dependent hydrolase YbcI (DUF457 family)